METSTFKLDKDIEVFCVRAKSFPDGVMQAHQTLHALVPPSNIRKYFGISRPEGGKGIIYRAAMDELSSGELSAHKLEKFLIKSGNYICIDIPDFMKNPILIGQSFQQLLKDPGIDPQGACIEWYLNPNDCKCMVKLK
jgi:hypothetical protein